MMSKLEKELTGRVLITHKDLDGLGCAIVYNKCFPGAVTNFSDYAEVNDVVKDLLETLPSKTPIMMSDLSLSDDSLCEEVDKRGNFELIDHHATAKWMAEKFEWALVDITKSATQLMFEVMSTRFMIEDLKPLVTLVNNYDTWGGGAGPSQEALKLNRLLSIYGIPRFFERFLANPSVKLTDTEEMLLEMREEEIKRYIASAVVSASVSKDAGGNTYAMIAIDRFISEACHEVLNHYPEIEYVMAVDFLANKVSLRGRGKLDLGKMARAVGGGGHRQSAGFPIQHGSQLRMVLACQGKCPVTDRLEDIIKSYDSKRP